MQHSFLWSVREAGANLSHVPSTLDPNTLFSVLVPSATRYFNRGEIRYIAEEGELDIETKEAGYDRSH